MNKITKSEIREKIKKGGIIEFKEVEFEDLIEIDGRGITIENISLINIKSNGLILKNIDCEYINLFGCIIENLQIIEIKTSVLAVHKSKISNQFKFEECNLGQIKVELSNLIKCDLNFYRCEKINSIDILKSIIQGGVSVTECKLEEWFRISQLETTYDGISISRSELNDNVFIIASRIHSARFYLNQFKGDVNLNNVILSEDASFIENVFNKSVKIDYKDRNWKIKDPEVHFGKNIYLDKNDFNFGFEISEDDFRRLNIGLLYITFSSTTKGNIVFKKARIKRIKLDGILTNSEVIFSDISNDVVILDNFDNHGTLKFKKIKPSSNSAFGIRDSDLGSAYFINIPLNEYKRFEVQRSTLNKVQYSDVEWPLDIFVSEAAHIIPVKEKYKRSQNVFRQLKQAAKSNDNKIDELLFQGKEWHFIEKSGSKNNESPFWKFNDSFILFTNRTNSFGTNWVKPIIWLISFNFLFYVLILISLSPNISFYEADQPIALWEIINLSYEKFWLYLHFLNPTHNLKHFEQILKDDGLLGFINNTPAMAFNVIMRIFTGYFIYQTIVAFRKFSRK